MLLTGPCRHPVQHYIPVWTRPPSLPAWSCTDKSHCSLLRGEWPG